MAKAAIKVKAADLNAMVHDIKQYQKIKFEINGKEFDVKIKRFLRPQERVNFLNTVITYCSSAGDKWEVIFDMVTGFAAIETFTDIILPKVMDRSAIAVSELNLLSVFDQCEQAKDELFEMIELSRNYMNRVYPPVYETGFNRLCNSISITVDEINKRIEKFEPEDLEDMLKIMDKFKSGDITNLPIDEDQAEVEEE